MSPEKHKPPVRASVKDETMSIRVYNTLSKSKEPFEPVTPGQVGIYLCGPTVYKPSHIGHMVGPVIFDVIKRHLRYSGLKVTLVVNITDVDDKLIAEGTKRGLPMSAVAEEMTADYMANLKAMGIDTIDHFPRATAFIAEMIEFIQHLIARGYAYAADGDVYFDVLKDSEYGKLSGRSVAQLQGEGGSTADRKHSPLDFALWKSAKAGEPSWDSPWGKGRPGWHIECSVMSKKLLGETFDMHGGGLDLIFPHHENEVAQSECCHGRPQAKFWLHNGLMQAADEVGKLGGRATRSAEEGDQQGQMANKISKTTGAQPFRELLQTYPPELIRYFLVSTHYRRPIHFSADQLKDCQTALETFYRFFQRFERVTGQSFYALQAAERRADGELPASDDPLLSAVREHRTAFLEFMDDDFNTGGAIGELMKFVRVLNRAIDSEKLEEKTASDAARAKLVQGTHTLKELTTLLGLFHEPVASSAPAADNGLAGKLLDLLVELRGELRKAKQFALADKIRNSLNDFGVTLEDRPGSTGWSLKN